LEVIIACEVEGEDENENLIDRGRGGAMSRENPSTTHRKMTTDRTTGEFIVTLSLNPSSAIEPQKKRFVGSTTKVNPPEHYVAQLQMSLSYRTQRHSPSPNYPRKTYTHTRHVLREGNIQHDTTDGR
jgi:hypothetical protein